MPFFLPNTEKASLYLLSSFLPDKENDPENILYTGKEDAHDGAQVSLQSRVTGYSGDSKIQPQAALFSLFFDRPEHDPHQFQLIFRFFSPDILYKKC
jgi:hypothetical protein